MLNFGGTMKHSTGTDMLFAIIVFIIFLLLTGDIWDKGVLG